MLPKAFYKYNAQILMSFYNENTQIPEFILQRQQTKHQSFI
jgi:hypothetical protein